MTVKNPNTDEQQAKRLHPLWVLFSMGKTIKEVIFPVVIFFIINIGSDSLIMKIGKIALILYLIYKMISILLRWWHFKYFFTNKEIHIVEGRFIREQRLIPLERFQNVQRNSSFFHRLFGLTSLSLNTAASGDDSSVKLRVITGKEAERVNHYISLVDSVQIEDDDSKQPVPESVPDEPALTMHYQMTMKDILVASFSSLSIFALIPLLLVFYSTIDDFFSVDGYLQGVIEFFKGAWVLIAIIVFVFLLITLLFGIGLTYIRYGKYQVTSDQMRIYVRKGLINQTEFSISKVKVQAIKLNKGFIRRLFGILEVQLVSAGGVGEGSIETSSMLFPFITKKKALHLLPEILPAFEIDTAMVKLPKPALIVKLLRPSYFWLLTTAVVFYFWPNFWYIPVALLVFIIVLRILDCFHSGYLLNGSYIQLESGAFSTELFLTTRMKADELEVTESWLQHKFGLASVKISTRAKPIHVATITDIPMDAAVQYYHWYANRMD